MKLLTIFLFLALLSGCALAPSSDLSPAVSDTSTATVSDPRNLANERALNTDHRSVDSAVSSPKTVTEPSLHSPGLIADLSEPDILWDRIIDQYAISAQVSNERVQQQLDWFIQRQRHIDTVAERAQKYLYYIVSRTEERSLPGELALLPIVESSLDPFAYSYGKASGIWQFIPSTGKAYGLDQDWWYDGRRDIRASTEAALNYLERLHDQFDGDWLLALASYNSGAGTVRRAIRKNKSKGLPTDYWSLNLPTETRMYVPRLIALAQLVRNPAAFNVSLPPVMNEPFFTAIETGGQIDLSRVAELAGLSVEDVYQLNPEYNRWSTHPEQSEDILIPLTHAERLKQGLSTLSPSERITWERYTIRRGDSLSTIASRQGVTMEVLRTVNNLPDNRIYAGKELLIPHSAQHSDGFLQKHANLIRKQQIQESRRKVRYKVRTGDNLWAIARRYDVKINDLMRWNKIRSGQYLRPGQTLLIWTQSGSA